MRVGQNPLRNSPAESFKDVVLCMVTHLPNLEGYHAERLEVVQTCLKSMVEHANMDHSLAIWDNGSCDLFREWAQDELRPDVFIQSFNAGKTAGRTSLVRMIPPKKIVCYSDDDIYFYPDWLAPQIDLLKNFPNVASVTGYPVRTAFRWGCNNTKAWAANNGELESGKLIPKQWEDDFAVSIGRDPQWHKDYTEKDIDFRVTYKGRQAYCTSHHCQFIAWSEVVSRVLSFDNRAMGDERIFDDVLDQLGLRLATTQRYTRHIGNVIHDELRQEIEAAERIPA